MNGVLKQIPIPKKTKFEHNHQCSKCETWTREMIITYSDVLEKTIYICMKCQPVKLIPARLPEKNEFRLVHECMDCKKKGKLGVLTYCHRCENGEFICPSCIASWFDEIGIEGNKDFDFEDESILTGIEEIENYNLKPIDDMTDEELLKKNLRDDTEKTSDKISDDLKDWKPQFDGFD